jgi:hypothetical protein
VTVPSDLSLGEAGRQGRVDHLAEVNREGEGQQGVAACLRQEVKSGQT